MTAGVIMFSIAVFLLSCFMATCLSYVTLDLAFYAGSIVMLGKTILGIALSFVVYWYSRRNYSLYRYLALALYIPPLFILALVWFYLLSPGAFFQVFSGNEFITQQFLLVQSGGRFEGLTSNPFQIAFSSLVAIAFLWVICIHQFFTKKRLPALVTLIFLLGLISIVYRTLVRSAFIALFFILVFGAAAIFYASRKRLSTSVVMLFVIVLFISLTFFLLPCEVQKDVLYRWRYGGDRMPVWEHFLKVGSEHPFGIGFNYEQKFNYPSPFRGRADLPPHNSLLVAWMQGGIGGLSGLLLFLFAVCVSIKARIRYIASRGVTTYGVYYIGAATALLGLWVNAFFLGVLFGEFIHSVLLGMVMAGVPRISNS